MDESVDNQASVVGGSNRNSLVVSRRMLFESITNKAGVPEHDDGKGTRTWNVSGTTINNNGSANNASVNNCTDNDSASVRESESEISEESTTSRVMVNGDEDHGDEKIDGVLDLPELKQLGLSDSVHSKRISYNIAVNRSSDSFKVATITSPGNSVVNLEVPEDVTTSPESPSEVTEVEDDSVERVNVDDRLAADVMAESSVTVKDEAGVAEDLSEAKISEYLSDISSSRITNTDNRVSRNIDDRKTCINSKSTECDYPQELNPFGDDEGAPEEASSKRESTNPFGSDSESEEDKSSQTKSKTSLNPFGSDSEEEQERRGDSTPRSLQKTPVPLPRSVKKPVAYISPQPSPRVRTRNAEAGHDSSPSSKKLSPTSSCQNLQTPPRKLSQESIDVSFTRSPGSLSVNSTLRKKKPAPPPPVLVKSTIESDKVVQNHSSEQSTTVSNLCDNSESNAKRVSASQWKNRKGPAPARPIPLRRPVKEMPLQDIETEISDIEVRQQELERQSVQLEHTIREKTELEPSDPNAAEEFVLQLFELVNEKNELLRRRSELMYMKKMHKLEEEHSEIEYQIRCLMLRPESNKTDTDKVKEEELLRRLLEVVEKRNEIIEAMDSERQRAHAEDTSVTTQLDDKPNPVAEVKEKPSKKSKKHKKEKLKEHKEEGGDGKSAHEKHSPSNMIKQKFMTLRHSAKKLHPKIPQQ